MIPDALQRGAVLLGGAFLSGETLALAAVTDEHQALLVQLAALVAGVVAVVAWIDHRIHVAIRDHSREDELRHAAILTKLETLDRPHRR